MALLRRRVRDDTPPPVAAAITAAAQRIEVSPEKRVELAFKRAEDWQRRAWELYDEIGEAGYSANYMGNSIGRLRAYVGVRPDPQGKIEPINDEPEVGIDEYTAEEAATAVDCLERLRSPLGGRAELQRRLGVNFFVAGDAFLIGTQESSGDEECWEVYSSEQVVIDWDTTKSARGIDGARRDVPTIKLLAPGMTSMGQELPPEASAHRLWRPHPRYRQWADSPYRRAMGILEELSVATRATLGSLRSRLHGPGVWFLPASIMAQGAIQRPNTSQDGQAQRTKGFAAELVEVTSEAIRDPSLAAAQVPFMVAVRDDVWEKLDAGKQLFTWDRDVDEQVAQLRSELLTRFAASVDLPPEIITGKAALNHWSAWNIDEDAYRSHIEPFAALIFDALTYAYLRPSLAVAGVEDVDRFFLWFDPTELIADPDETDKTKWAHASYLISDEVARERTGYTDDDAPDDEEVLRRLTIDAAKAGRAPTVTGLPGEDGEVPPSQPPAVGPGQPEDREGPPPMERPEPEAPAAIAASAKDRALASLGKRLAALDHGLLLEAHTRADQVMRRALERANARLKSLALRSSSTSSVRSVVRDLVPEALEVGPALGEVLILTFADDTQAGLFAGAFDGYLEWWDERTGRTQDAMLNEIATAGDLSDSDLALHADQDTQDRAEGKALLGAGLLALAGSLLVNPNIDEGSGEYGGELVPIGAVRRPLGRAGGGGERATSLLNGSHYGQVYRDAYVEVRGWTWDYGDAGARFRPFPPHVDLDGFFFADVEDDELGNAGGGWPGVSHYWPGDHSGCKCQAVPEFRRVLSTSRFVTGHAEEAFA